MRDLFLASKGFLLLNEKLFVLAARLGFELFTCPICVFFFFHIARHRSNIFLDGVLTISNISLKTGLHLECQMPYRNENKGSGCSHLRACWGILPLSLQQILKGLCVWGRKSQGPFLSHSSLLIPLSLAMVISIYRLRMGELSQLCI